MTELSDLNIGPPVNPSENDIKDHGHVLNEIKKILLQSTDAFGKSVRLGTTNEADIASHYNYSPERHRVYVDDQRQFIQYDGPPAQFEDTEDSYILKPQAEGETVRFSTAERFRYVVQYVIEWSMAFQINQDLQEGDVWAVGYGNPDLENATNPVDEPGPSADGWFVYQNADDPKQEATLAEYRDGTAVSTDTVNFAELPQIWGRLSGNTNWYNVGVTEAEETYTEIEEATNTISQRNDRIATVANNTGKGPISGNQRVNAVVKTGAAGAGSLEMETGSVGLRTLGDVSAFTRAKTFSYSEQIDVSGAWIPLLAIREDPNRVNVNVQYDILEILEFTGGDDSFALLISFDSDNVLDSNGDPLQDANYEAPNELNPFNSVIQINTNVDQVPDVNGTIQTSMQDPGGYQVGFSSLYSSGAGTSAQRTQSAELEQKRQVPNGDVAVLMGKSPSTGTLKGQISTEQDW